MPGSAEPTIVNGRYRLEEPIGSGGFGKTWRATDELLGMPVAVKAFADSSSEHRERYLREARSLAKFWQEPGIVAVRDYFEDGDSFYLVMEYLEGEDLSVHLKRTGALSLDETIALLSPVMQTLEHLHEAGVIHRDVSPDNLRILPNGQMKLLDFGSALSTNSAKPGVTVTVKPGYAPPEQYGDVSTQGPWTDVYALAATIWQCLTGRKPMDSLQRTFHDELATPSSLGARISPMAESALMKALVLDSQARTKSVGELLAGLLGQPMQAGTPGAPAAAPTPTPVPAAAAVIPQPQPTPTPRPAGAASNATPTAHSKPDAKPQTPEHIPANQSEPPKPPKPERPVRPTRPERAPKQHRTRKKLPIIPIAVAVVILGALIAAIVVFSSGGANPYREPDATYSRIRETVVSAEALEPIARDAETKSLELRECQIDDAAIARIGEMSNIEELLLINCVGYTTLEPLAANESLWNIYISGFDGFDGNAMMPVEYPAVTKLTFDTVRFSGSEAFLEHFPNLETVQLSPVEGIASIGFLSACPNISSVNFDGIDLSGDKWKPLAQCPNLDYVSVNACKLATLEWAANCPQLGDLNAAQNNLTSIDGLQGKERLYRVVLQENEISDITPLEGTTEIITAALAKNSISDLGPLRENKTLYTLDVAENDLDDAGAASIGDLTGLETLGIAGNHLTNLDFCERLIKLIRVDASANEITTLGKLASCSSMKYLFVHHNQLKDIEALGNNFDELTALNIAFNQISSLEPLSNCHALEHLIANDNQLENLDGMQDKPALEDALFYNNKIDNISGLRGSVESLAFLDLGNNAVSDISVLSDFGSAADHLSSALLLERNKITDASVIPGNRQWREISLYENPLNGIAFLAADDMEWNAVYLPHMDEYDYTVFESLHALTTLQLVDVPYEQQAKILRDRDDAYTWQEPTFITLEQADSEMATVRDKINRTISNVAGLGEDTEDES